MTIETRDGSAERRVLTAMIINKIILAAIAAKWDLKRGLFSSDWANMVGAWCVRHYKSFKQAPGKQIQAYFEEWAERGIRDKALVQAVENYLDGLSQEYALLGKDFSKDFILDQAGKLFNRVRISNLKEDIEAFLESGDVDKADNLLNKSRKIEIGMGSSVDVFQDLEPLKKAASAKRTALVKYPGALENFFGFALERSGFIGFMGKNKVGKSLWLADVAWRSALQGLKVGFFGVGDMTQDQYYHRFMARVMGRPYTASTERPVLTRVPTDIENPATEHSGLKCSYKETIWTSPLEPREAWKKFQEISKLHGDLRNFKLCCSPSIGTNGIFSQLEGWAVDNWVPDVVVIDYADLLTPGAGFDPSDRAHINQTWKDLNTIRQQLDCLVVTATQSDTAGFDVEVLTRKNFNGDRRILDHVTGMVGINQNNDEKKDNVVRLNWINARDWAFDETKCCYCVGCPEIAETSILSCF